MPTNQPRLPTADQQKALCDLLYEAFVELRHLPEEQAHDLAYAVHNIPKTMYGWGHWSVEGTRGMLTYYQTKHAANGGFDYVAAFDAIFNTVTS
jgi:hypothetical protein